jgi:hypothetical protein
MSDLTRLAVDLAAMPLKLQLKVRTVVRMTGLRANGIMRTETPVDTGALRGSVYDRTSTGGHTAEVGTSMHYGVYVARGTRRMAANPYDLRTLQRASPEFVEALASVTEELL